MIPVSRGKTALSSYTLNQRVNDGLWKRLTTNRGSYDGTACPNEVGIWNENGKEPSSEKGKSTSLNGYKAGMVKWRGVNEKHSQI